MSLKKTGGMFYTSKFTVLGKNMEEIFFISEVRRGRVSDHVLGLEMLRLKLYINGMERLASRPALGRIPINSCRLVYSFNILPF